MKIDHIAINVSDLEGAAAFFGQYFGGIRNEMYHNPRTGLRTYFMTFAGECRIELMNRPGLDCPAFAPMRSGYVHLSFSLGSKESVDSLTKRLVQGGYELLDGPRTTGDGYYESCIKGFEDNIIELTE